MVVEALSTWFQIVITQLNSVVLMELIRVLIVLRGVVHGVGDGSGQGLDSSLGRLMAFNGLAELSFPTTTGIKSSL